MLAARDVHLQHRAPRDARTHRTRRRIAAGLATPWEMILEQEVTDLLDGAPIGALVRAHEYAIASLVALDGEPTPQVLAHPLPLVQRETRAQAAKDEAEHALLTNPDSVDTLARYLATDAHYRDANGRLGAAVRERLVRLRHNPHSLTARGF